MLINCFHDCDILVSFILAQWRTQDTFSSPGSANICGTRPGNRGVPRTHSSAGGVNVGCHQATENVLLMTGLDGIMGRNNTGGGVTAVVRLPRGIFRGLYACPLWR